jgi:hypothetical protein
MNRCSAALLAAFACAACGPQVDFEPKHPEQPEYPRVLDVASRVPAAVQACEPEDRVTVGVVHAYGDPDDVIPALAKEAAQRGGTHYVVEGDKEDVRLGSFAVQNRVGNTTVNVERAIWAIVYRCATATGAGSKD